MSSRRLSTKILLSFALAVITFVHNSMYCLIILCTAVVDRTMDMKDVTDTRCEM